MRIDVYGMTFDGPGVTIYLWSPWRCSALEHRLFEGVKDQPLASFDKGADELRIHLTEAKAFKHSMQVCERVLKGWQEEGSDLGTERRLWRWMIEADSDAHGYDHAGEKAAVWGFIRLLLDRGEGDRSEEIDLNGFGFRIWRADEVA